MLFRNRPLTMLARGITRRCPNCGASHVFRRWVSMVDRCPRCGLYFEREDGYWTGSIALNTIATEFLFIALLVMVVVWTWPDIPSTELLVAGLALNAIVPIILHPISKTLWVAIDLLLHPLEPRERHEVESLHAIKDRSSVR